MTTTADTTPTLLAADLSARHIGQKIRVTDTDASYTGTVEDITYDVEHWMCGRSASAVRVEFDRATIRFPLTATVEVLG